MTARWSARSRRWVVAAWAPIEGARTFWQALYDVDDRSMDVSFFLRDDGESLYTEPITVELT